MKSPPRAELTDRKMTVRLAHINVMTVEFTKHFIETDLHSEV